MDKYIGKLLDNRYEILELIGSGGMALVYKAKCHRLNRLVAVKILKDEHLRDEDFRKRFKDEAQAVAMLSHPNIVSIYDVSKTGGVEYIVMELIEGISLKEYMKRKGVLSWKETLYFASQVANALEHAHSRGIIHRDIKPHNIMILRDGTLKVADFGIARLMMKKQQSLLQEALGSVHYVSPEQAKGSYIDARTDIYSLGVVMYEMLTGRLPFEGDNPITVAMQHINAIPLMPTEINPQIPLGMEQITMKAMNPSLEKRYSSASQLLMDLEMFKNNPTMIFSYSYMSTEDEPAADSEKTRKLDDVHMHAAHKKDKEIDIDEMSNSIHDSIMKSELISKLKRGEDAFSDEDTGSISGISHKNTQNTAAIGKFDVYDGNDVSLVNNRNRRQQNVRRESSKSGNGFALAVTALVTVLFFVGAIFFAWKLLIGDTEEPEILKTPKFVGLDINYVLGNGEYVNNFVIEPTYEYNEEQKEGIVLNQKPSQGTSAKKGSTVVLTVSSGKKSVQVPDLRNWESNKAQRELSNKNLFSTLTYDTSDTISEGQVIQTIPAMGESVYEGDTVILVISQGKKIKTATVPLVIGMTEMNAWHELELAGLAVGSVENVERSDIQPGLVLTQSIVQGTQVDEKTAIDLTISVLPAPTASEPKETEPTATATREIQIPLPTEPTKSTVESVQATSSTKSEEVTKPTTAEQEQKTYNLPINLDKYTGSVRVMVKLNGEVVYDEVKNASVDKVIYVTLKGNGTGYIHLYIDNKNVASQIIVFE